MNKQTEELSKRNKAIATAKAELAAAQAWLESVPTDCDPLDIVRNEAIVAHWPERISALVRNR